MAANVYYGSDYYEADYYASDYYDGEDEEVEVPVVPSIDAAIGAFGGARRTMRRLQDERDIEQLLDMVELAAEYKRAA